MYYHRLTNLFTLSISCRVCLTNKLFETMVDSLQEYMTVVRPNEQNFVDENSEEGKKRIYNRLVPKELLEMRY